MIKTMTGVSIGGLNYTVEIYKSGKTDLSIFIVDNETGKVVDTVKVDCPTLLNIIKKLCPAENV